MSHGGAAKHYKTIAAIKARLVAPIFLEDDIEATGQMGRKEAGHGSVSAHLPPIVTECGKRKDRAADQIARLQRLDAKGDVI